MISTIPVLVARQILSVNIFNTGGKGTRGKEEDKEMNETAKEKETDAESLKQYREREQRPVFKREQHFHATA